MSNISLQFSRTSFVHTAVPENKGSGVHAQQDPNNFQDIVRAQRGEHTLWIQLGARELCLGMQMGGRDMMTLRVYEYHVFVASYLGEFHSDRGVRTHFMAHTISSAFVGS